MKFKSITLHNFMRYKGDNTLLFSTDDEKNVTVVLGNNTFGKTTLAQAFRWGLYEKLNDTNYSKQKDMVLLNNEVITEMSTSTYREVFVEIVVCDGDREWKFNRRANFSRKSDNPNNLDIRLVGEVQLTMQIKDSKGIWSPIINNAGGNKEKEFKAGCVQETIDNMFPPKLSNYFFFDGERWNDLKTKTEEIKNSVETILGVRSLLEMKKHIKDGRGGATALSLLNRKIKGVSGEAERLQKEIQSLEDNKNNYLNQIDGLNSSMATEEKVYEDTKKILNDNRKVEEDQQRLRDIERDINNFEKYKDSYYADLVRELSESARYYASSMLPEFKELMSTIDLEGKDIPGVTIDTIDYLLELGECLCGSKLTEGSDEYNNLVKLKKLVPPEMLGGAAGKLMDTLEDWENSSGNTLEYVKQKADGFTTTDIDIEKLYSEKYEIEKRIDKKTNLGAVREKNKAAERRIKDINQEITRLEFRVKATGESIDAKNAQLEELTRENKENESVYRAIKYAEYIYNLADRYASGKQEVVVKELNEIIGRNFKLMFNDREKYAKLEQDYKVHVYYHQLGELINYEETHLSNGETIAINFVFIVSILELAKRLRSEDDDVAQKDNMVLGLPLVLDGAFSALSNDNTELIAKRLPMFAEQVIIFILDKDWEASGLDKYTLPGACYRVSKEEKSNSSSIVPNDEVD